MEDGHVRMLPEAWVEPVETIPTAVPTGSTDETGSVRVCC
jgi:hypothetical protein